MSTADLASLVKRLEAVTTRLESAGSGGSDEVSCEYLNDYEEKIVKGPLKTFYELSDKIGGDVKQQVDLMKTAFTTHGKFLELASRSKTPNQDQLKKLSTPLENAIGHVQAFFESHRSSKQINYLQAVKEMIGALGWVVVSPKPGPYVKEMAEAARFYTNRVLKSHSLDDTAWSRSAMGWLEELQKYIKEHHTTGVAWNKNGGDPAVAGGLGAVAPPPPAGAPPPPPPPAVVLPAPGSGDGGGAKAAQSNLFAQINQQGGGITSGLKKVTNDMKTYKNPELRGSSVVKASDLKEKKAAKPATAVAPAAKKPPVCALQGKRWLVEYQEDNPSLKISDTNRSQTVYMYKCNKCTINVEGKLNAIILDNCKRVAVVFDSVIGTVEFINCQSIQAQATGVVRTISIDKTDGCMVYLSKDSLECEFITAKSSEMNVAVPKGTTGEFSEFAVPEQFRTKYNGKGLTTQSTEING